MGKARHITIILTLGGETSFSYYLCLTSMCNLMLMTDCSPVVGIEGHAAPGCGPCALVHSEGPPSSSIIQVPSGRSQEGNKNFSLSLIDHTSHSTIPFIRL